MKKEQILVNQIYKKNDVILFVMILRLLDKFINNLNKYDLEIINELIQNILYFNEDKEVINFDKFTSNLSLIERLSKSENNEEFENREEFESFLDYSISSGYFIFSLNYDSEKNFPKDLENKFIDKSTEYKDFRIKENKSKNDRMEDNDFSYEISKKRKNESSINKNYDISIDYNDNLLIDIENVGKENNNFTITYTKISSINQKEFHDNYEHREDIDNREIDYSTKDLVNEIKLVNNSFVLEINGSDINNELKINILTEYKNEIVIKEADFHNESEKIKLDKSEFINEINNREKINSIDIYHQKLDSKKFYFNFELDNNSIKLDNTQDLKNKKFGNNFHDKNFYELKENKNEIYSEKKDFESEITPCLDIDFCPERIENKKYSLFRGGLELKVNEYDLKDGAIFGVIDKKTNSGKAYNTNANEISALIFKALEEKGIFADFEFSNGQIYLKDVNGTRMFIEDNQNVSVNDISYKIVLRDNKTKEEIKNFSLNDKLNPGDYKIDIIAEVNYGNKFSDNFERRSNKTLENNSPDFNVMTRDDRKIRAYCINDCGFETNGKDTILDQIIKVSEKNGYDLELETMDTIANNKIRAKSVTYIKDIVGTKEKYLELHPTAKENKIGILYLVFDENNKVLGEVGYRDEGLEYVARKGLKIKPVIYELGANIKDAYAKINNAV